jgi:hypothetical protein
MQSIQHLLFLLFLSVMPVFLLGQKLDGVWSGKISRTTNGYAGTESFEVQLFQAGKKITGHTFAFKDTSRFVLFAATGLHDKRNKTLILEERGEPVYNLPPHYHPCEKVLSLNYYKIGNTEYLMGKWTGVGVGLDTSCFPGEDLLVVLQKLKKPDYPLEQYVGRKIVDYFNRNNKIPDSRNNYADGPVPTIPDEVANLAKRAPDTNSLPAVQPVAVAPVAITNTANWQPSADRPINRNTPTVALPTPAPVAVDRDAIDTPINITPVKPILLPPGITLAERRQDIQQILRVQDTLLRISLYDNAMVDDDTVTLFINKKPMLVKQRISNKPLVLEIPLVPLPGQPLEILMQAENLGSIPPNTALMIVECGKRRYEVRLSAGFEKHAVVVVAYDPD